MRLPERCIDLTEDHIDYGLVSVERMRELLEHLARVAKANEGAAKILVAISRIATTSCEWLEGRLHVEVDDILGATEIEVSSDLGGAVRELIFPRLLLDVSQAELVNAVKVAPRLVTPLKYRVRGERMVLTRDAPGTVAPPPFEIAEESLRRSLPAALRRSLPPPSSAEGSMLGRVFLKAPRVFVVDGLDVGWDAGAYSSGQNTRETKPPPPLVANRPTRRPTKRPAKRPSKRPTQPPAAATPPLPDRKRPVLRKIGNVKSKPRG